MCDVHVRRVLILSCVGAAFAAWRFHYSQAPQLLLSTIPNYYYYCGYRKIELPPRSVSNSASSAARSPVSRKRAALNGTSGDRDDDDDDDDNENEASQSFCVDTANIRVHARCRVCVLHFRP